MGYEELNVIDPTTGKPVKAETDMSDVRVSAIQRLLHL